MPASDLALLTEAAHAAAQIAKEHWRADPPVWEKAAAAGPVSAADLDVDRMLRQRLTAARPGYGWLSEETEDDPARLSLRHCFIVDPIDGTRAFVAGDRTWAHSLALSEEGRIIAAVVYLPLREMFYAAARDQGATLNARPIRTGARADPQGATTLTARANLAARHWAGAPPAFERHFRPALAYRLCLVAEGRFDATITLRDTWEWDIAAGSLIAEEAGCAVSDRQGAALKFNSADAQTPGAIVTNPALHAAFLARLA